MNSKQKFIEMVETLITIYNSHPATTLPVSACPNFQEALVYFEALKVEKDKEVRAAFTDNGKLILDFMLNNHENSNNMFKAREIADGTFLNSRSVSGSMRKLVSDGYVEKIGQDPILYALTQKGKELSKEVLN